jgi:hypothetical protein
MSGWPCHFFAETTMPNRRKRTIQFEYDGSGDFRLNAQVELRRRLHKPYLWYGVGYAIVTPFGTKLGTIECVDGAMRLVED